MTLSSFEYPSEQFFNALKSDSHQYMHTSFDEYKQTHLTLSIFLPSLEYTEISEIPKITIIDMISGTGGALGIFLGLSIFSFIEIFEILFQISYLLKSTSYCKQTESNNCNEVNNQLFIGEQHQTTFCFKI